MPKKSGSKSSRGERRAGRQRAERAREHGLPARAEPSPRARAVTPEPSDETFGAARSSASPSSRGAKPAGIPTLVKVIGGAFVILLGVYLLSRQRDEALTDTKPAAEPATASSLGAPPAEPATPSVVAAPELTTAPEVKAAPELTQAPEPTPQAPAPVVSVTPPTKPVVAGPAVPQPAKSKLVAPVVPAPASVPPPAAPKPPAPASAPRVDNPY